MSSQFYSGKYTFMHIEPEQNSTHKDKNLTAK